jgi:putative endonuclease
LDGGSIYILRGADGSYYAGVTRRSVDARVSKHVQGLDESCYTFRRRPVTLAHAEHYSRIADAVAADRRIKGWSRAKKDRAGQARHAAGFEFAQFVRRLDEQAGHRRDASVSTLKPIERGKGKHQCREDTTAVMEGDRVVT